VLTEYLAGIDIKKSPLKRVISWRTQIMSTQKVRTGEFIGYGTNFMAPHPMKIAIIPTGYAHGFGRSQSNTGKVLIRGKTCVVVGMVSMNSIAVDITDVPKAEANDEVVLIGRQQRSELSVASFSEHANQLNYELLTRLPRDIPRIIIS
jgi:alanine racemase